MPEHPHLPGVYTPGLTHVPGKPEPIWPTFSAGPPVDVRPGDNGPTCAHCNRANLRKYRVLHVGYGRKLTLGVGCIRPLLWNGRYLTVAGAQKLGIA